MVYVIGFKSIMPYNESAVWCVAIQIMMRTAKKRALILAVGGGFDVAARKRVLILVLFGVRERVKVMC